MLLAVLTLLFIPCSLGCGISTHTEIGFRAIQYFGSATEESALQIRDILLSHQVGLTKTWTVFVKLIYKFQGCFSSRQPIP